MKKLLKYMAFAWAIALVFTAGDAFAAKAVALQGDVFTTVGSRMINTFQNARSVIFIVGGFGLIGLGFAAIFGKVNWKWLAALACGLAIVAVAGQIVDYTTRPASQAVLETVGSSFGDTMSGTAAVAVGVK